MIPSTLYNVNEVLELAQVWIGTVNVKPQFPASIWVKHYFVFSPIKVGLRYLAHRFDEERGSWSLEEIPTAPRSFGDGVSGTE